MKFENKVLNKIVPAVLSGLLFWGEKMSEKMSVDKIIFDALEDNNELTQKQKDFCRYFIHNRNATQAYLRAYGVKYGSAGTGSWRLMASPKIKAELRRLREIKNEALGGLTGEDIVEMHMRIAFADIKDFVEFDSDEVEVKGEVRKKNFVRLRPSKMVDGQLIDSITEGSTGVKIKLADRQKSLAFLERYFELNPMDNHKKEYDNRRLKNDDDDDVAEPTEIILRVRNDVEEGDKH